jgi:two-component system, cell cycle response regulator CtrA
MFPRVNTESARVGFYTRNREKTVAEDTRWWYEFVANMEMVCAMRVLLVDDDVTVGRGLSLSLSLSLTLTLTLKASGVIADLAETGQEALELLRPYEYDLVILDLMLQDMEGSELVRRMRVGRNHTPVLVLTGLSRPDARVKALSSGADDVMTKPFDKAELLARMQTVIRRSKGFSQPVLRVGRWS